MTVTLWVVAPPISPANELFAQRIGRWITRKSQCWRHVWRPTGMRHLLSHSGGVCFCQSRFKSVRQTSMIFWAKSYDTTSFIQQQCPELLLWGPVVNECSSNTQSTCLAAMGLNPAGTGPMLYDSNTVLRRHWIHYILMNLSPPPRFTPKAWSSGSMKTSAPRRVLVTPEVNTTCKWTPKRSLIGASIISNWTGVMHRPTIWKLVWDYISSVNKYSDVIIGAMAFQITSLTIVYSTVYSGADQRKHQSSTSLAFVRGIHRWPVNSPHKGPVTRKMFPFDDVIMHMLSSWAGIWLESTRTVAVVWFRPSWRVA